MNAQIVLLTVMILSPMQATVDVGKISGIALNGTEDRAPLAGAEIVLRASLDGAFITVAQTTTDSLGRFSFDDLPADGNTIYLPGVNWNGIHYPGLRTRLEPQRTVARVTLVAYDTIESPCPLISRKHEIEINPQSDFLEITETLVIENPSLTSFVGTATDEGPPVTCALALPEGLETVTFDREFHGRNFQLVDGKLVTNLPFRPGEHKLKFTYRLPANRQYNVLARKLDLPTDQLIVRVVATDDAPITCNLAASIGSGKSGKVFEHPSAGEPLPVGYALQVQLGSLPISFNDYARGIAIALLAVLLVSTIAVVILKNRTH